MQLTREKQEEEVQRVYGQAMRDVPMEQQALARANTRALASMIRDIRDGVDDGNARYAAALRGEVYGEGMGPRTLLPPPRAAQGAPQGGGGKGTATTART